MIKICLDANSLMSSYEIPILKANFPKIMIL